MKRPLQDDRGTIHSYAVSCSVEADVVYRAGGLFTTRERVQDPTEVHCKSVVLRGHRLSQLDSGDKCDFVRKSL